MMAGRELRRQLEHQRFLNGVAYVRNESTSLKKMSTSELAHLNQILTGESDEPWRFEAARVQLPTGKVHDMTLLSNPVARVRDILGEAQVMVGNGEFARGAAFLYSELVLGHYFQDANRRTAVLATVWLLAARGFHLDGEALLRIPIGELREARDRDLLLTTLKDMLAPLTP